MVYIKYSIENDHKQLACKVCVCVCAPTCVFSPGKYHALEQQLIQEFTAAQRRGEIGRMREVAAVLLHSKVTHRTQDHM